MIQQSAAAAILGRGSAASSTLAGLDVAFATSLHVAFTAIATTTVAGNEHAIEQFERLDIGHAGQTQQAHGQCR